MTMLRYLGTAPVRNVNGVPTVDRTALRFDPTFGDSYEIDDLGVARKSRSRARRAPDSVRKARPVQHKMIATLLAGANTPAESIAAGATETFSGTITIRPQFDFIARDASLNCTATIGVAGSAGTNLTLSSLGVTSVMFGDRVMWQNTTPIPLAVITATGFVRNLLRAGRIQGGLDITVTIEQTVASTDAGAQSTTYTTTLTVSGFKIPTGRC